MKNNLYIIVGKAGEYEDSQYWNVTGFFDIELAFNYLEKCKKRADEIYYFMQERNEDLYDFYKKTNIDPDYQNQYDKFMMLLDVKTKYQIDIIELIE